MICTGIYDIRSYNFLFPEMNVAQLSWYNIFQYLCQVFAKYYEMSIEMEKEKNISKSLIGQSLSF